VEDQHEGDAVATGPFGEAGEVSPPGEAEVVEPSGLSDDVLAQIARNTATTKTLAVLALVAIIVGVVGLGILIVNRTGSTKTVPVSSAPTSVSTSTAPAAESAAGKPCVATTDPLPAGAPSVAVVEGPPPTDLVVKDLKEGTGAVVAATDTVTVNYIVAACSTGKIIDSSYKTGQPATIALGNVIPGFAKGVTGMKVGGQRLIGIPSDQAYGPAGKPPAVAPDEAVWFVVDLAATKPA
jgi:peptidylprolyl isomerase